MRLNMSFGIYSITLGNRRGLRNVHVDMIAAHCIYEFNIDGFLFGGENCFFDQVLVVGSQFVVEFDEGLNHYVTDGHEGFKAVVLDRADERRQLLVGVGIGQLDVIELGFIESNEFGKEYFAHNQLYAAACAHQHKFISYRGWENSRWDCDGLSRA